MRQFHVDSVDSTNLEAKRLWEKGEGEGGIFAVTAEEQTAGLGRSGRMWHSPRGGIWMTVAWPVITFSHRIQTLPLVVGHTLATVLEVHYSLPSSIKWPNDVLINGRKIAGILCQGSSSSSSSAIFIGIGINANFPVRPLGTSFRNPATSLQEELGREIDREEFREHFLNSLECVLRDFEQQGLENLIEPIRRRLAWVGEWVTTDTAQGERQVSGAIAGIDDSGRLILRNGERTEAYYSGELQRIAAGSSPQA